MSKPSDNKPRILLARNVMRYEIIKTMAANSGRRVRLLSARQYAERFQFSQRTIATELAKLAAEGWIVGQKGVGYFTNPQRSAGWPDKVRITGIALGDTQFVCCDYNQWAIPAYIGLALASHISYVRNMNFYNRAPEMIYEELRNQETEALVWVLPPPEMEPYLRKLQKDGTFVVTVLSRFAGIPSVLIDFVQAGREVGALLDRERRGEILWCNFNDCFLEEMYFGVRKTLPQERRRDLVLIDSPDDYLAYLADALKDGRPPRAVVAHRNWTMKACKIFQAAGLDYAEATQLIVDASTIQNVSDFHGIVHTYPFDEIGRSVAEMLHSAFLQPESVKIESRVLHLKVKSR